MGNIQTRRDKHGAMAGGQCAKERGDGRVIDGQHANERGWWCHRWVMCNERTGCGVMDGQHVNESGWQVWCCTNKRGWVDV